MRKILLFIGFVLILTGNFAIAQDALDSYLKEAAQNNPGLKAKFNEYLAALEKVPQVGGLPDPQISFGYFIQPVETRVGPQKAKISASQMFPWFGTLGARKDVATEMAKGKYEAFQEAKSRLFYAVRSSYYRLYFTHKAIDVSKENIEILNIFRKLSLAKVKTGIASTVDVLRVEIEIADLENQLALFHDQIIAQSTAFNNLLDVKADRPIITPDTLPNKNPAYSNKAILDSIRNGNHSLLKLDFAMNAYKNQEIAAKRSGAPKIMVGADYIFTGKSSNPSLDPNLSGKDAIVFPMVGISIPIYRKKYNSMVKEASLLQESAHYQKTEKLNELETTYAQINNDYLDAERRIQLNRLQTERANKALNILQTEYENSGENFEEVLRMERRLLKYKLELEKARSDKDTAIAFINYLMGQCIN